MITCMNVDEARGVCKVRSGVLCFSHVYRFRFEILTNGAAAAAAARERPFLHVMKWTDTRKQRRSSGARAPRL